MHVASQIQLLNKINDLRGTHLQIISLTVRVVMLFHRMRRFTLAHCCFTPAVGANRISTTFPPDFQPVDKPSAILVR